MKIARAVTVPASSEFVISGSCSVKPDDEGQTFVFEASENAQQHLLVARGLVSPKTGTVPVKLINQRPAPLRLKKGFVLGTLQPGGSIFPTNDQYVITQQKEGFSVCNLKSPDSRHQRKPLKSGARECQINEIFDGTDFSCITNLNEVQEPEIPEHLQDLFGQSFGSLVQKDKIKLARLLVKYQDTFARSRTGYGKCSLLKHGIDTAEAAPVRQPLPRTPQAFEKEEEKYIQEQLEARLFNHLVQHGAHPLLWCVRKLGISESVLTTGSLMRGQ